MNLRTAEQKFDVHADRRKKLHIEEGTPPKNYEKQLVFGLFQYNLWINSQSVDQSIIPGSIHNLRINTQSVDQSTIC